MAFLDKDKRPEAGLGGTNRGGHAHGHSETVRQMGPSTHAYGWLRPCTGAALPREGRPFIKKAKIRKLYVSIKKAKIRELLAGLLPKEG